MIEMGVDDEGRDLVCVGRVRKGLQQCQEVAFPQRDAVLALGREPAAVEALGGDRYLAAFVRRPVEIVVHRLFGQPADQAG